MKIKLLSFIVLLLLAFTVQAQIPTSGNEDDFTMMSEGTMNWSEAGSSPNPPYWVASGGPAGASDAYMANVSSGPGMTAGSRAIVYNQSQWTGDFSGFVAVQFDARANTNDLEFRVAMYGAGGSIASSNSVVVTTAEGWKSVTIPIGTADMQTVTSNLGTGTDVDLTLQDCFEFRIVSASAPAFIGDKIDAIMDLDNIVALSTLSTPEFEKEQDFQITPNPGNSIVTLKVPVIDEELKLEVFDILGKKLLNRNIIAMETRLNVGSWKNGVYLVRLSGEFGSQTKRFIKQ
ncbi:MAG: T9SS type A sorting domain-containing protein [Bacteroidia bacterium]|nr:T9SS type A sorting domain-containing protein [Bacteroidia bacterium]MBT8269984.1 T9SS type A sorting domain-containing protein [Bacteroidia bacterium]NNF82191.1 T9SS type A sorting domain-containing protein [Flavobacteriaceae bacterium]NNK69629.1 T9SS type A sorting domain-containing protein [Flavobacteriaceae bacterium]